MLEDLISERIIGCAFRVANTLGPGFLEKVYENALLLNFGASKVEVRRLGRDRS